MEGAAMKRKWLGFGQHGARTSTVREKDSRRVVEIRAVVSESIAAWLDRQPPEERDRIVGAGLLLYAGADDQSRISANTVAESIEIAKPTRNPVDEFRAQRYMEDYVDGGIDQVYVRALLRFSNDRTVLDGLLAKEGRTIHALECELMRLREDGHGVSRDS